MNVLVCLIIYYIRDLARSNDAITVSSLDHNLLMCFQCLQVPGTVPGAEGTRVAKILAPVFTELVVNIKIQNSK